MIVLIILINSKFFKNYQFSFIIFFNLKFQNVQYVAVASWNFHTFPLIRQIEQYLKNHKYLIQTTGLIWNFNSSHLITDLFICFKTFKLFKVKKSISSNSYNEISYSYVISLKSNNKIMFVWCSFKKYILTIFSFNFTTNFTKEFHSIESPILQN